MGSFIVDDGNGLIILDHSVSRYTVGNPNWQRSCIQSTIRFLDRSRYTNDLCIHLLQYVDTDVGSSSCVHKLHVVAASEALVEVAAYLSKQSVIIAETPMCHAC